MDNLNDIQVIILAGGLGMRLRPITKEIPKPMIDILGKPFLEYKIEQIKEFGMRNIILCVGYLGEIIEKYFGDGSKFGVNLQYSYEKELLGTAGAVKNAEKLIDSNSFIVMNGDTYSNINLKELFFAHNKHNFPMTMVVTKASNPKEQELVEIENDLVIKFHQRDTEEHKNYLLINKNCLINAGTYIFNKNILNIIPPERKISLEKDIFPKLTDKIVGFPYEGYFEDLANLQFYKKFENDVFNKKINIIK